MQCTQQDGGKVTMSMVYRYQMRSGSIPVQLYDLPYAIGYDEG